ncbi:PaaI family thioesterase [Leptospira adleri]|uniref:DUF4442 domain-containing protein n=1 Tax=Leptospira adleri TaxID=2023186 RepID=A0A2M9YQQ6_9LEPT|nr:DUF4442 domain-containing protein [Leptospira adleri]PJZ53874.1 DUF4442 domain-containing protein [Leptospira adleri]PJZ63109.1 DUF4442 domain-containing protein [Leptospira adleri]TGM60229.1 DUF4442 domain-containing protein [Leptospira adleri]
MKDRSSFWKTGFFQWKMFLKCPVYWRCGGRILQFSDDLREMKVKLPFNRKTRGLMGTHFGGALYAFVDPIPLLMLKENLGENYILWDINGAIEYVKATSQDVFADFKIGSEILNKIQGECEAKKKTLFHLNILIQEKNGDIVAKVDKTIYVRKKPILSKKRSA